MFSKKDIIKLKISKVQSLSCHVSISITDYARKFDECSSDTDLQHLEQHIDKDIANLITRINNKNVK